MINSLSYVEFWRIASFVLSGLGLLGLIAGYFLSLFAPEFGKSLRFVLIWVAVSIALVVTGMLILAIYVNPILYG